MVISSKQKTTRNNKQARAVATSFHFLITAGSCAAVAVVAFVTSVALVSVAIVAVFVNVTVVFIIVVFAGFRVLCSFDIVAVAI